MATMASAATHVVAPLAGAGFIYLYARPGQLMAHDWLGLVIPAKQPTCMGQEASFSNLCALWAIWSLPDGLWAYSLLSALDLAIQDASKRPAWILAGASLAVGWEVLQSFGLAPGTFDWADLLTIFSSIFLYRVFLG